MAGTPYRDVDVPRAALSPEERGRIIEELLSGRELRARERRARREALLRPGQRVAYALAAACVVAVVVGNEPKMAGTFGVVGTLTAFAWLALGRARG